MKNIIERIGIFILFFIYPSILIACISSLFLWGLIFLFSLKVFLITIGIIVGLFDLFWVLYALAWDL